jgi:DNA repair exonuclease SbcCD ATPase subunit
LGKDGFLGVIFTEVLQQISDRANKYLSLLPNTSHVSVTFETENAKGKKTISPVFWVDGHATTRASGLSGGMGASADLAVDLGVIGVVEERLGKAPGWICLDETFNGMPKGTKEQAIEILKEYATNRLVVVIDHSTEIKESFDQTLTVVAVGDKSVVQ